MALVQVRAEIVRDCLVQLRKQKINAYFAGYLWLKRESLRLGTTTNLPPTYKTFFDTYLLVPDAPAHAPYHVPFSDTRRSTAKMWFNRNVAGSYAPSSVRKDQPFDKVVSITVSQQEGRYTLRERHWELARTYLAHEQSIPVVPLAVFLYRDYAINTNAPSVADIVQIFRDEFGYGATAPGSPEIEYEHLYYDDSASDARTDWFEEYHDE